MKLVTWLRGRQEWQFFAVLPKADAPLAAAWWIALLLRGALPVVFALGVGWLVGTVQRGDSTGLALTVVGVVFVLLQVLTPIHQAVSSNLGDRTAAFLHDRLMAACVGPQGMGHLEDPSLANDLSMARDFELGMTGPPLAVSMDFIAAGLIDLVAGLASVGLLFTFNWWAPLVLGGAWVSTHWLLRESGVWRDRNTEEVRSAQRDADYAYRLAVDASPAKELRLFGLVGWTIDRFVARRTRLHALQYEATRLREKPMLWSLLIVVVANILVFWAMADAAAAGLVSLAQVVVFAQAAAGASLIAFGGLSWAVDSAAPPVAAVLRLESAMHQAGALPSGSREAQHMPAREIRFRDVTFAYPGGAPILEHFDLTIRAGSSLAIVGTNGAGKTTIAKLLCRLYDPQHGAIEVDGVDLRALSIESWRGRLAAVFQDFIRFERSLRDNVATGSVSGATRREGGRNDHDAALDSALDSALNDAVRDSLSAAGAANLAELDTILARGYDGGTELAGGQWQRVALARALCAVRLGASVVLLDEPTAQLDVRGEAEIFERILAETRHCTTILISHRFSTVRQADRICVLEHGRVVELGTHEELMAKSGRYRTMFDLQAERFGVPEDEEGVTYDVL